MKGNPIGPLAQWGKDLTYYHSFHLSSKLRYVLFCLVNWDMYYLDSACRGSDLPPGRILYIHYTYWLFITIFISDSQLCRFVLNSILQTTHLFPLSSRRLNWNKPYIMFPRNIYGRRSEIPLPYGGDISTSSHRTCLLICEWELPSIDSTSLDGSVWTFYRTVKS